MEATRATEQSQDSKRQIKSLDDRYGKIGILAVAAAVRHKDKSRPVKSGHLAPHLVPQDSD
jgi:hypothetical protein